MSSKTPNWMQFEAGLTEDEQARYADFKAAFMCNENVQELFFAWAKPIVERLELGHIDPIFGAIKSRYVPKNMKDSTFSLAELPTPLVRSMLAYQQEDEKRPFRRVHRLIDAIEVFCKIHTVAGVGTFMSLLEEKLAADSSDAELDRIRTMLAAGLKTPSLGIWWGFARETAKALDSLKAEHILPGGGRVLTQKNSKLKKAFDGNKNLITFRNDYAHGATPSDTLCRQDLAAVGPRLETLVQSAGHLAGVELLVVDDNGSVFLAKGPTLQTYDHAPEGLRSGRCYLHANGRVVDLHPLLVCTAGEEKQSFFFYNDLRSNHASLLNYPYALYQRSEALRGVLLERFPLDDWKKLGGHDLDPFRERIASLTEVFKGRTQELQKLAQFLHTTNRGFHVVWGPPGVGKSALLARMIQLLRWSPELREQASPGIEWPELKIKVLEYFIRRGSTDTAGPMLDSLNQRIDSQFGLRLGHGTTDEERRRLFVERIQQLSKQLKEDERVVLVFDGLDEARHDDPIKSCLPREVPENIIVIYGSRPQQLLRYGFYDELDRERRSCVDLGGLSLADTRALLYAHINKYELEDSYAEAVLKQSEGNPLYLKLLCQGLEQDIYQLNDQASLPTGMSELYNNALVRIQKQEPRAITLLNLLAAARDFVSPAMAAELMNSTESELTYGPFSVCMELLYENPLTEDLLDYQLFHESLREYLWDKNRADVVGWEEKLAQWCTDWKTDSGDPRHRADRLFYAMRFAAPHQATCRQRDKEENRNQKYAERGDLILGLVEDEPWRAMCFQACGNGGPLQRAIRHAQDVVRERDVEGSERRRMLRFVRWYHDEPFRLYEVQRDRLRTPLGRRAGAKALQNHLELVPQLAKMGARPRDRVMLAITALWAPPSRPTELPEVLKKEVGRWLEEAKNPALDKLWMLSGGA